MAAAVGSLVVRSKVRVPEVVNCPEGDTVTVGRTEDACKKKSVTPHLNDPQAAHVTHMWFLEPV